MSKFTIGEGIFPYSAKEAREAGITSGLADINKNARIPQVMRGLRARYGYNQQEVADAIGVVRITVIRYELGDAVPDAKKLYLLAKLYRVSSDYLLGLTDDMHTTPPEPEAPDQFKVGDTVRVAQAVRGGPPIGSIGTVVTAGHGVYGVLTAGWAREDPRWWFIEDHLELVENPQPKFEVGDIVKIAIVYPDGPKEGMMGTIEVIQPIGHGKEVPQYGVSFPGWTGHNLDGRIEQSNGWWTLEGELELIKKGESK